MPEIEWRGDVGMVRQGSDDNVLVEFYKDAMSGEDYVSLRFPGDKHYIPKRPVKDSDKLRWPRQWEAYERGTDQLDGQIRLEEVAWINEGLRRNLQSKGIMTLEQLAGVVDANLPNLGHAARTFRDRAKKELAERQKAAQFDAVTEAAKKREAELLARIEALEAKRGPGRPPKVA